MKGATYKLWGLLRMDRHLFGVTDPDGRVFIFGADVQGRDVYSR